MAGTLTASVIKNDTTSPPQFQNSAGTQIGTLCRTWVNFVGSSGSINASFNVSSITVNGSGDYTVNFTNAFADTAYSVASVGTFGDNALCFVGPNNGGRATGSVRVIARFSQFGTDNPVYVSVAIFR